MQGDGSHPVDLVRWTPVELLKRCATLNIPRQLAAQRNALPHLLVLAGGTALWQQIMAESFAKEMEYMTTTALGRLLLGRTRHFSAARAVRCDTVSYC